MTAINPQTQIKTSEENYFSERTRERFQPYVTSVSKFSKGMLEGLTTIAPLFKVLDLAYELISGINDCGFMKVVERDSPFPFTEMVITGPIIEELLFRELFQRYIAKDLVTPYIALKDMVMQEKTVLDKKTEKAARINIASLAFALMHLNNLEESITGYVLFQTVTAFFGGRMLGEIAESELGTEGSSGAHVANNLVCYVYSKYTCA